MRSRPGLITSALAAAVLLASGAAASAQETPDAGEDGGSGWVWIDDDEGAIDVGAGGETVSDGGDAPVGGGSGAVGDKPVCVWEPVPDDYLGHEKAPYIPPELRDHDWYFHECTDLDGTTTDELVPIDPDAPGGVSAEVLREQALSRLELPTPRIEINPSDPVVHVETWLWVEGADWTVHSESASAAGVTSTVTARPSRVVWDMGNGDEVICGGPGAAYDRNTSDEEQTTDCSYIYRHSSAGQPDDAYVLTATIEWELEWTVSGDSGGGPLPIVTTSDASSVRVKELQALNH